jgi:hypothetical protein
MYRFSLSNGANGHHIERSSIQVIINLLEQQCYEMLTGFVQKCPDSVRKKQGDYFTGLNTMECRQCNAVGHGTSKLLRTMSFIFFAYCTYFKKVKKLIRTDGTNGTIFNINQLHVNFVPNCSAMFHHVPMFQRSKPKNGL